MEILWTKAAAEDVDYWKKNNQKHVKKIKALLDDIIQHPYEGIGKPEPLKYHLSGLWSRRITREHRLIYKPQNDHIIILSCRHHYE